MSRLSAFLVVCLSSQAMPASAADAVRSLSGFTVSSWSTADDVPIGSVRALAQGADGYLWLGTNAGLLRFDGSHFTAAETLRPSALPKLPVRSLFSASTGDLWIGLADGGGVFVLRGGEFLAADSPVAGAANAITEGGDGSIWVGDDKGLLRLHSGIWTRTGISAGLSNLRVYHLRENGGVLDIGTAEGLFRRSADDRIERVAEVGDAIVRDTILDSQARRWITDPTRGLKQLDSRDTTPSPIAGRGFRFVRDGEGDLWLATVGQGLWRIGNGGLGAGIDRLTVQNGLLSDGLWALLEDREGNIWIGTQEGLNRLTRHILTPLLDLGITASIARSGDTMWVANLDGLLEFAPAASASGLVPKRFPLAGARTVYAADGVVWASTNDGVYRFAHGRFMRVAGPDGVPFNRVTALTSDARATVWLADTSQGLWRWSDGQLLPYELPREFRASRITALHGDAAGTVWIAFAGGTLGAISPDGAFRTYTGRDGLVHDVILGIYEDVHSGLWFVGSGGISRMVGNRFATIGPEQGLPTRRVTGITGDGDGSLWVAFTNIGIGRLRIDEFERAVSTPGYQVRVRVVDTTDGMAGVPTSLDSRTAQRAADGRLWFVTGRGLTVLDPRAMYSEPEASGPVRVEAAVADDRRFTQSGSKLPSGTTRVRIDYTALNLTEADHLRFRYRLEGFDDAWREAGTRRQAFYTNLPPREYRFTVQVANSEGDWSTNAAQFGFSIAPRYYQRPIFYGTCAVALLMLIGLAWQVRLRQVRREFTLVLAERARVSREVHDTLLQSMVGIALQIDDASRPAEGRGQKREQLVSIRRQIEDCIVEARQAIWNMRAGSQGHGDLIAALEFAGARATAGTQVRFRLSVIGTPYRYDERVEGELLRIAQEALVNAVRHAHATTVQIELTYSDTSVILRVIDDGSGFEQEMSRSATHFGLATMRERAEHLGGKFRLRTTAGSGTEIETTIPVSTHA